MISGHRGTLCSFRSFLGIKQTSVQGNLFCTTYVHSASLRPCHTSTAHTLALGSTDHSPPEGEGTRPLFTNNYNLGTVISSEL